MTKHELAQELRERQYQLGQVPRAIIDSLSDDDMIDSYITCSHCGKKLVDESRLPALIDEAFSADHFLDLCDLGRGHVH